MEYLGYKYYVGLITAASYYGASHQAPQIFQVMVKKELRSITCGKVKIQFIKNRTIEKVPSTAISTAKSRLVISSPEATAMDLLKFIKQSGGLNNVATILTELKDSINAEKLRDIIEKQTGLVWKQRLGYILELIGADTLASVIKGYLLKQPRVDYILLQPGLTRTHLRERNQTWKVIENVKVESDI